MWRMQSRKNTIISETNHMKKNVTMTSTGFYRCFSCSGTILQPSWRGLHKQPFHPQQRTRALQPCFISCIRCHSLRALQQPDFHTMPSKRHWGVGCSHREVLGWANDIQILASKFACLQPVLPWYQLFYAHNMQTEECLCIPIPLNNNIVCIVILVPWKKWTLVMRGEKGDNETFRSFHFKCYTD